MNPKPEEQKTEEQKEVEQEGTVEEVQKLEQISEFYQRKKPRVQRSRSF